MEVPSLRREQLASLPPGLHHRRRLLRLEAARERKPARLCTICLERLQDSHVYKHSNCEHAYHRWCFKEHLASQIRDGTVEGLRCPECTRQVSQQEVHHVVSVHVA